jgi:hypothetical protein
MLPRNMGRAHRAMYFVIGVAAIGVALLAWDRGEPMRLGLGVLGIITLASSVSGY